MKKAHDFTCRDRSSNTSCTTNTAGVNIGNFKSSYPDRGRYHSLKLSHSFIKLLFLILNHAVYYGDGNACEVMKSLESQGTGLGFYSSYGKADSHRESQAITMRDYIHQLGNIWMVHKRCTLDLHQHP